MPKRKQVMFQGRKVWGELIDFEGSEQWNTYELKDGTSVKMKTVVGDIVRLEEFNEEGDPIYVISSRGFCRIHAPEELRKDHAEKPSLTQ